MYSVCLRSYAYSVAKETTDVTTMKAIVQDRYGSASVLTLSDISKPEIGDHDVLVRVHAAGVHPTACA